MINAEWLHMPCATLNENARREAEHRQSQLTKPPGALGRLESLAIRLAAMQGTSRPTLNQIYIAVFAGDHGVAAEGVSAFPQAVTAEMVRNFARGGAAINVLARELGATLEITNLGTVVDIGQLQNVHHANLGPGTANFTKEAAMSDAQLMRAMHTGRQAAERAKLAGTQLFIGGEMGIGNTTSATAIACALLDMPATTLAGPGTGLDVQGVGRKAAVVREALRIHAEHAADPVQVLRRMGGFEIAALAGAYLACAKMGLPTLIDGFIATAAALVATRISPQSGEWYFYSHASAEPGHAHILKALGADPLLDLGMRLGEGSGAAVSVPILRLACALHGEMATFAEAGVSEKTA